jgi:hypothetical protein
MSEQKQPAAEKPKAQILPKRHDDILDERLKEAREVRAAVHFGSTATGTRAS